MQCFVVHNVLFAFDKLYCFLLISFSSFLLSQFLPVFLLLFYIWTLYLSLFLSSCVLSVIYYAYVLFKSCFSHASHLSVFIPIYKPLFSHCAYWQCFFLHKFGGYLLTFFFNFIHFVICSLRPTPVPCLWILTVRYTFSILLIFSLQSLMTWIQTCPGWLPLVLQAACQLSTLTPSALWKKLCSAPTPAPSSSLDL